MAQDWIRALQYSMDLGYTETWSEDGVLWVKGVVSAPWITVRAPKFMQNRKRYQIKELFALGEVIERIDCTSIGDITPQYIEVRRIDECIRGRMETRYTIEQS